MDTGNGKSKRSSGSGAAGNRNSDIMLSPAINKYDVASGIDGNGNVKDNRCPHRTGRG